jgi:hypothetical protein
MRKENTKLTPIIWISLGLLLITHCSGCVYVGASQVGNSSYATGDGWNSLNEGEIVVHISAFLNGEESTHGIPYIFLFSRDKLPYNLYLVFATPEKQLADKVIITHINIKHHGIFGKEYEILREDEEVTESFSFDDMSKWDSPSHYRARVAIPISIKNRSDFKLEIEGRIISSTRDDGFRQTIIVNSKEVWYLVPAILAEPLRDAL